MDHSILKIGISPFLRNPQRHKSIKLNRYPFLLMILIQYHMCGCYNLFCRIWYISARARWSAFFDHLNHAFLAVFAYLLLVQFANLLHFEN
jgi:hypothetical protein